MMEYETLAGILREQGWDVVVYDTVQGQRDPTAGTGVWTVAIDHGGQVLFRATWPAGVPRGERFERAGHRYRLLQESTQTLSVATDIASPRELPAVLDECARLALSAQDEPVWAGSCAER